MENNATQNKHDCREYIKYAPQYHFFKAPYSDECDFSEDIIIFGLDKIMKATIYLGENKIQINSPRDLSLYYAFGIARSYTNPDGSEYIKLSYQDLNTLQITLYGEYWTEYVKKYRQNWYEAIVANGFDEQFAWKWVYEQSYSTTLNKPENK